ncbi:YdcF family protein [Auraticoccus monumenti]|uniref:DUF218 domain-containing protein n=1 Tax=Auraticoccus monumenti TaxID=675864 RepID=A0A1G7BR18_9ACTN|nr:ElyC/SanA/YdcF family protein [Auraticoccus monumenti]SDE29519.1 DUF218 domain-containing protein [Auraticoccus monumenti]
MVEGLWWLLLALPVGWVAVRRTRAEPRRLSNGFWLLAAALLALNALVGLGLPGSGVISLVVGGALVLSPLLVLVLAVLLVANGVQMVRKEGRSLGNLLSLMAGLALLVLLASPVLVITTDMSPPVVAGVLIVLLAAAYLGFVLVGFLGYSWLYPRLVRRHPAAWVVVLGSGLSGGERVTPLLAGRIRVGVQQTAARGAGVLVMSGGRGRDEALPEAEAMAAWALAEGGLVRGSGPLLLTETTSTTTEENLRHTAEMLSGLPAGELAHPGAAPTGTVVNPPASVERDGPSSLAPGLVVSSDYHVLRAAILARQLGIPAQAVGAPTARYFLPSAVLREYVAVLAERPWLHVVLGLLVALPLPALVLLTGQG